MKNTPLFLTLLLLLLPAVSSAQWEYLGGPFGIRSIVVVDSHVFAGTNVGLFRLKNNDTSWTKLRTESRSYDRVNLSIIESRLFIGTGEGVIVTSDYGATWDSVNTGLGQKYVFHLASDTLENLWVNTNDGLLLSVVPWQSWTLINDEFPGAFNFSLSVSDSIVAVGSYMGGLLLSRDKGKLWTDVDLTDSLISSFRWANIIVSEGLVFTPSKRKGILYVPRHSAYWEIFNSGLANDTVNLIAPGPAGYIYAVTSRNGIFLLSNRGENWVDIGNGFTDSLVSSLIHVNTKEGPVLYVGANNGVWRRFITLPLAPEIPVLLAPVDSAKSVPLNPTIAWQASSGATSYRLQVSTDQTFQKTIIDEGNLRTTTPQIMGLLHGTKYYWRVSATNFVGTSGWSTEWSFTTVANPDIPTLLSPDNMATNIPVNATFTWNAASSAESYALRIATTSIFMAPLVFSKSGITDTLQAVSGLPNATTLYWTVNASNSFGSSAWSPVWSFTTASINDVGSLPNLTQDIELHQNHPNPFAERTTIRFRLVLPDRVTLDVFDLFGRRAATLVDERRGAGEHSVVLNAERLSNGLYVYRLTSNGRTSMKLALVAK